MKFFLIEIEYVAPIEKIDEVTPAHREFLQVQYDIGVLLLSGPKVPRIGGMIIAKSSSQEELLDMMKDDPFLKQNCVKYNYKEFVPAKYQVFLKDWLSHSFEKTI
ncbi:hypothetical protein EHQ53_16210 [Leptospira langatensis]|uniref:YCII-related domain-containing protein n=1 Tax=Leptospira langatensis TaxID=2484983 RepID=A0A5F1ZMX1_9LEPT|nr:YciI family protein [Leptospira langatensis]TGK05188.1 hypothetical protein EHO57_00455 [Leptospira langatensis]TGL38324.1 hypothetical protein EHQ53_16210 [Leptospira langatensis]